MKPVMMKEIVLGHRYVEVVVDFGGRMRLENHIFYGEPEKTPLGWKIRDQKPGRTIRLRKNKPRVLIPDDSDSNFRYLEGAGMVPSEQNRYADNFHRTFRHNGHNLKILKDLVERQDLRKYLGLIGIKDPQAEIKRIAEVKAIFG